MPIFKCCCCCPPSPEPSPNQYFYPKAPDSDAALSSTQKAQSAFAQAPLNTTPKPAVSNIPPVADPPKPKTPPPQSMAEPPKPEIPPPQAAAEPPKPKTPPQASSSEEKVPEPDAKATLRQRKVLKVPPSPALRPTPTPKTAPVGPRLATGSRSAAGTSRQIKHVVTVWTIDKRRGETTQYVVSSLRGTGLEDYD